MDERTRELLTLAREYYEKREYDRAEPYLRDVLERSNQFADVFNMLGVIQHDRGKLQEAQASFEEALHLNPHYTEAALNLAVTYNDLGRYDEAKRVYKAALDLGRAAGGKVDPFIRGKIANLHAEVAQAYADAGMIADAMHELRKAILLCPDFGDLRVKLANLYRQKGDLEAARFELEEAIRARPGYIAGYVTLGVVWLSLGEVDKAIAQWNRALELDPDHKSAKMYLKMTRASRISIAPPAP